MTPKAPHIDWAGLSPLVALLGGAIVVLLAGLLRSRFVREQVVPALALVTLARRDRPGRSGSGTSERTSISGALRLDELTLVLTFIFCTGAASPRSLLSWRALRAARGRPRRVLRAAAHRARPGMFVLVAAQNLVTLFLGLELLSIPLYVLCATEMRRERVARVGAEVPHHRLGRLGDAALRPGAALRRDGSTDFARHRARRSAATPRGDPLLLTGIALTLVGLAFKASVAPFHQWTPDVYEGAPTPVTAFMAVATKAAAFGVDPAPLRRRADRRAAATGRPALAALATITIIVGNVGALGPVLAQAPAGLVVGRAGGLHARRRRRRRRSSACRRRSSTSPSTWSMNLAAFAVIVARERETGAGRRHRRRRGHRRDARRCWPGR